MPNVPNFSALPAWGASLKDILAPGDLKPYETGGHDRGL
jgi:hypothetical protein